MFHRFLLILILCVQSVPAQEDRLQSGFETDPDIKRNIISLAAAVMNEKTDISLSQYIPSGKLELKDSFFLYHRRLRFSDGTGKAFTLPFVYQNRLYLAAGFDKRERTAQLRELLNHYFRPLDYYEWEMPENNCVLVAKLDAVSLAKGDDQMRKEEAEKIFLQHGFVHPFERFFFRTALHIALTGNLFVKEEAPLPVESPNPGIKTACLCKGPYADQINNLVAGILRLSDTATHIPPSLVNHPTLEKIAFLYDASVVALILDAAGKKEEAERILDYFHCILQTDLAQLPSKLDSDNIYGIVKLYKGRDGRMRKALLNALNVDCFLNQGEGMLEFYTTPGPNSFLYFAMHRVNKEKYSKSLALIQDLLSSMQNSIGGILDGDRLKDDIHTEPHCDAAAVFLMHVNQGAADPKWPKKAEDAYQWFIKHAFDKDRALIYQGTSTDKFFATDTYTWTMAGPFGDRLASDYGIQMLEKLSRNMLNRALVKVSWFPPGKKESITQILVDFTDPQSVRVQKKVVWDELDPLYGVTRGGYHPSGSVEWTGGAVLCFQKNAVRAWQAGNQVLAAWFKDIANALQEQAFKSYYRINNCYCGNYATAQNTATGHNWISPLYHVEKILKGCSPVSCWPVLPELGVNPFIAGDDYKTIFDQIPCSSMEEALKILEKELVNPPYEEKMLTEMPGNYPQLREPRFYIDEMWDAFKKKDYQTAEESVLKVINEPRWRERAILQNQLKAKRIGGLVDYLWGQTFVMNRDYRHEEIWKYPILNEYGTALWGLIYITCLDENPSETKERMNDLVLHFNLAQIADGNKRTVVVEGKQHDYFAIKGYWNPVLSMWRPSACGGEREQKMRSLFSDLIEEDTSLEKNIPKTVMLPNPEGSEDPDLKYFSGQPEEIWMQHQISDESRDDSREEYAVTKKFSSPYPLYKGDTLEISYSLTEGKGFALKLQDDAFQADSFRNTLTFKKVLPHGVVRRKVENSLMLTALSFHYGRKLWGDLGCSKNTILEIHSVKVYPLKKKGVMEKKTRQKDRLEQLLYSPRTLDGQNKM